MNNRTWHIIIAGGVLLVMLAMIFVFVSSANRRFQAAAESKTGVEAATASASDEKYCSPALKTILRRVLTSCGLVKEGAKTTSRGCQPMEAKNVAAMSAGDFNALFLPMAQRAGIVQFKTESAELDAEGQALLDKVFADQRGASYFLVVSRASPEGALEYNRALSEKRANSVLDYLKTKYNDPDLEREVGLLWLGAEFAQLDKTFCSWNRSHTEECNTRALNRSAFITWIDCHL